jgi:mRNA interferase MazF
MKQGEIWYADLNPTKGSEQAGHRPILVLSGNLLNTYAPVIICCPLTTSIKNYKGNLVVEPNDSNGLTEISEILIYHIRSISKTRLTKRIGSISKNELESLIEGLNDLLKY